MASRGSGYSRQIPLHTILERVADQAAEADGPGAVAGVMRQVAERLVGFELQMGPYAVAELRATDLLASRGASAPDSGMRFYVTDTLDDPHADTAQLLFANLFGGVFLRGAANADGSKEERIPHAWVGIDIGNGHHYWLCLVDEVGTTLGEGRQRRG